MPRISLIFRTDVHVSDRSPASWKADYPTEIWSNLEQIKELVKALGADAVLDGGDYFHVKAATRNPHHLVAKTAEIHRAYGCPIYAIEGNHDIAFNNLDTVGKQPMGVLFASGVFRPLRDVLFERDGVKVRAVGFPYSPFRTLEELRALRKQPGDQYLVAVVHALAGENPPETAEDFFKEPVFRYRDLVSIDGPDIWMFGHWHKDQGIVEIEGKQFVNQGAISRGALVRENIERTPQVAVIEASESGISARTVKLHVAAATDVFDFERKTKQEAEVQRIDQFIDRLGASLMNDPTLDIDGQVKALDFAADVRDRALAYLDKARSETP
jgi:DNA repair exonuclease SbcCD nuclease subunit